MRIRMSFYKVESTGTAVLTYTASKNNLVSCTVFSTHEEERSAWVVSG